MRVIVDGPRSGAENMRRDVQLLEEAVPTLRLYGWRPACVSLGYAQPEQDVDADAARDLGVDVVRRPTGGGAILHAEDEVTYAVILPRASGPRDLFASYRFIAQGVRNALAKFGIASDFMEGHGGREGLCYLREEGVSVGVRGRKISGGAQKRTPKAILQHGTLLVQSDLERNARLFHRTPDEIAAAVTSLRDLGLRPGRGDVRTAMLTGFVQALADVIEPEPTPLTAKA